jgi:hypothetical protein
LVKWEYGWYLKLLNKLDKTREKCGLMFSDELIFKYKKSILKYDIFHISLVIIFLQQYSFWYFLSHKSTYRIKHNLFHISLVIIQRHTYWPTTSPWTNMGRKMITRLIWKMSYFNILCEHHYVRGCIFRAREARFYFNTPM